MDEVNHVFPTRKSSISQAVLFFCCSVIFSRRKVSSIILLRRFFSLFLFFIGCFSFMLFAVFTILFRGSSFFFPFRLVSIRHSDLLPSISSLSHPKLTRHLRLYNPFLDTKSSSQSKIQYVFIFVRGRDAEHQRKYARLERQNVPLFSLLSLVPSHQLLFNELLLTKLESITRLEFLTYNELTKQLEIIL